MTIKRLIPAHRSLSGKRRCIPLLMAIPLLPSLSARADTIESVSGISVECKILSKDSKFVVAEVLVGGSSVERKYPIGQVRAITIGGKREVINAATVTASPGAKPKTSADNAQPSSSKARIRPRAEVEALIQQVGREPPDWLESTALNYPQSLDLTWPEKAPGDWDNQKNMGQFLWDVIYPNPGRWHEGVKLIRHIMELQKSDPDLKARAAQTLGHIFHALFQDYARAAWWMRQAGKHTDQLGLAECYWKLGNKQMAIEILNKSNLVFVGTIKLWSDMGDTDKALKLAELFSKSTAAAEAYVNAADACRLAGRYPQALQYYDKALAVPDDERNGRAKNRARASMEAIKLFDTLDVRKVADGTYTASSLGYETEVEIEVKVAAGRIDSLRVTRHREKQFYAAITETPARIIQKQSVKGVDATSRATITSEAIINATAKALLAAV